MIVFKLIVMSLILLVGTAITGTILYLSFRYWPQADPSARLLFLGLLLVALRGGAGISAKTN